jgi:hypothetical protein
MSELSKKEFADRSKRSLNLKERSAKPHFEQFALERRKVKKLDIVHSTTHYWKQDTWPISILFPSKSRCELGDHIWHISRKYTPNPAHRVFTKFCRHEILYVFFVSYTLQK